MRTLLVAVWATAVFASALAAQPQSNSNSGPTATLLQKAIGLSLYQRESRPTGQCIVSCDGRMITLKRCADGECPDFDCATGVVNCGSR